MNKEYILEEIRRTAKENGAIPLGRQRFFAETGIKESDWSGKYWVRWGDAVSEAGFTPNKKNEAYDEQWIFEKYISLVRELGRIPVNAEVRMKGISNNDFPSHNTFKRIGSTKKQLIARIVEYCHAHDGYQDVLVMCETATEIGEIEESIFDKSTKLVEEIGYIYLIKSGRYYKIGRSNSVGRREREIAIQLPDKSQTVHTIRTDDPIGIEAYWHKRFQSKRKNGEWFELNASDVTAFKGRKFM